MKKKYELYYFTVSYKFMVTVIIFTLTTSLQLKRLVPH